DEHSLTEDVEMAVQLAEKGYLVKYASDITSWQETPYNLTQLVRQRTRWFRGYMETAIKYGRLLRSPSKLSLDTEITLIGPYILVLCLLSYIVASLTFLTRSEVDLVSIILACLTTGLMGITLLMIGTTLAYVTRPRKIRNILWIPFIYSYWALQNLIAARAFLHIILRRPRIWTRTVKRGTVTSSNLSLEDTPRAAVNLNLRVCFVSSYPPNRARLSEYAQSLLKELGNRPGIDRIYVLADMVGGSKNRVWISPRVEVLRVWKIDHPFSILGIILCILKLRPDVVHFNVHFQSYGRSRITNFVGLSLPFLCRVLGVPSVVLIHNLGERVNLKALGIEASFFNRLGIRLATRLITLAKAVTVTVRSYAKFLGRRYQCRNITFVPHGTAVFNTLNQAPVNPHRTILMFGHMSPYKGLPLMLEVFNRLVKERDYFRLVIAGNSHPNFPDYLDKFRENPPPNVEFTGYVDEARLPELFQNAFIVVLPYLTGTGTSGVFHLACGFGKPIVASDLPEIRELVTEGASALLVPPNDVEGFSKAIVRLCDDPELAEEMGKRNLSFASRESWSAVASSFEQIYSELASK
ncbi:MAG: glycosyltransferase, partial [Candidatus Bathyarchaeia archaeon]